MILVKMGTQNAKNRRAARAKTLIFLRGFNDFGENGYLKPEESARCARQNVEFPKGFQLFRCKWVPKNPKNRRAARAKTLNFPRNFNDFGENGYPKPEKSARCARQNVDFPKEFQ